jgi:hypothetical protein
MDVEPSSSNPAWRNNKQDMESISKRLDQFLVSNCILQSLDKYRTWVEHSGLSDHCPKFLQLRLQDNNPTNPFKFNSSWLGEVSFQNLVKDFKGL